MKLSDFVATEAIAGPGIDSYIADKAWYFSKSPVVYKIGNIDLKTAFYDDDLYYGLFDKNSIIGLFHLSKYNDLWQVRQIQIEEQYKGMEYGTFLYDYAVMNDGLSLISDTVQSDNKIGHPSGTGGSKALWEKLYRHGRFTVCGYNLLTNSVVPFANSAEIYTQHEDIVWMATPKPLKESINEMLSRLRTGNRHRTFEFYGTSIVRSSDKL